MPFIQTQRASEMGCSTLILEPAVSLHHLKGWAVPFQGKGQTPAQPPKAAACSMGPA